MGPPEVGGLTGPAAVGVNSPVGYLSLEVLGRESEEEKWCVWSKGESAEGLDGEGGKDMVVFQIY